MKPVAAGSLGSPQAVAKRVRQLCDASQQVTEEIADAYTVTVPSGFVPVRTLDLTSAAPQTAAVLATLLMDLQQRGAGRRTSSV